ncbi:hypothetical protein J6590_086671 [Homalodisca vitripennis]|nr:hypothetical protein J6590_086671 [Homalodisca vitripennis]
MVLQQHSIDEKPLLLNKPSKGFFRVLGHLLACNREIAVAWALAVRLRDGPCQLIGGGNRSCTMYVLEAVKFVHEGGLARGCGINHYNTSILLKWGFKNANPYNHNTGCASDFVLPVHRTSSFHHKVFLNHQAILRKRLQRWLMSESSTALKNILEEQGLLI